MKEEKSRLLNHSRSYNRLEGAPKYDVLLSSFFSKQFLGNVKHELSKKTESTRHLQINNKNGSDNINHKIQLYQMEKKIKELSIQNRELKRTIENIRSSPSLINGSMPGQRIKSIESIKRRQLQISSCLVSVQIRCEKQDKKEREIQKLKEKIQQLEIHKSVKEQRLNEMLEKQVRYQGQIRLLRLKGSTLENEVKNLKESFKIQMDDLNLKPLKTTNISEVNLVLPESGSSDSTPKMHFTPEQLTKLSDFLMNIRKSEKSNSLLASNCETFEIPDHLHLSKLCLKKSLREQPINEIDQIIQEELPFIQSADLQDILGKNRTHKKMKKEENAQIAQTSQDSPDLIQGTCQSIINIDIAENTNVLKSSQQSLVAIDLQ